MLEKLPSGLGRALKSVRAGTDKLAVSDAELTPKAGALAISSAAFADHGAIPPRFTADGEGLSPPLQWEGVPQNTEALLLLIEDPDSPTPRPLVHAIACNLVPRDGALPEGALGPGAPLLGLELGRNSYLKADYIPPDPPSGHGPHRYAFELFALDCAPSCSAHAGRGEILEAVAGHVLASGVLIGTYERP
jgi:Raf kinase inhibitor-like YbhB/YbcL family protein